MENMKYCIVYEVSNSSTDFYSEERRSFQQSHEDMIKFVIKAYKDGLRIDGVYECVFAKTDPEEIQTAIDTYRIHERQENIRNEELKREGQHLFNEFLRTLPPEVRKVLKQKE